MATRLLTATFGLCASEAGLINGEQRFPAAGASQVFHLTHFMRLSYNVVWLELAGPVYPVAAFDFAVVRARRR